MQDKQAHNFDDAFVGRAWEEMRQRLDEEMPVQPQRAGLGALSLLLIGLLCGLVLSAGLWWYAPQRSTETVVNPTAPAPTAEVRPAEATVSSPSSTEVSGVVEGTPATTQSVTAPHHSSQLQIPITKNSPAVHPSSKELVSSLSTITSTIGPVAATTDKAGATPTVVFDAQQDQNLAAADRAMYEILSVLPISIPAPLDYAYLLPADAANSIAPIRQSALRWGVEAGVHSLDRLAPDGFSAQVFAELGATHRRTYARFGVGYQALRPEIVEHERTLSFSNTALSTSPSGGDAPPNFLATRDYVSELNYATVKASLGYRMSSRLAMEVGINAGALTSSTRQETWSYLVGPTPEEATAAVPYLTRLDENGRGIQRYNAGALFALRYQIKPSLALRVNYQHGWVDVLTQSRTRAPIRGAGVSLAYYFR